MKQQFAIFDFDGKSYPITQCHWNSWNGQLMLVVASLPYERDKSNMDFGFSVVKIDEDVIFLEGVQNKKFTAKILLK